MEPEEANRSAAQVIAKDIKEHKLTLPEATEVYMMSPGDLQRFLKKHLAIGEYTVVWGMLQPPKSGPIDRAILEAQYLIEHQCTIQDVATAFGLSYSTVRIDLSKKISDPALAQIVKQHLGSNKGRRYKSCETESGEN